MLIAALVVSLITFHDALPWPVLQRTQGQDERWATVTAEVLNVRAAPGIDAPVVGSLGHGDTVRVIGEAEAGFVPVAFGPDRSWLAETYVVYGDGASAAGTAGPWAIPEAAAVRVTETKPRPAEVDAPPVVAEIAAERWIDIDRSHATVTLYVGDRATASFVGRIGRDPAPDSFYSTAVGTFRVYGMNEGLARTPFAEDAWLTDWVGFDPVRRNGIHSPVRDAEGVEKPWQNPTTMGCVRLDAGAAETVFAFTRIGMRVEVHE